MTLMAKLNLGCGPVQPKGWQNVDGSKRAWLASRWPWLDSLLVRSRLLHPSEFNRKTHFANLLKRLPWPDESIDCVFLGEVLEHFTREDGRRLLSECYRIMKPGGILRVRVPDNARFWRNYISEFDDSFKRPRHLWSEDHSRWIDMFFRDISVRQTWMKSFGHYHKYMYDEISLVRACESIGFVSVERRRFLDSAIPDVQEVETHDDLTVECLKPGAIAQSPRPSHCSSSGAGQPCSADRQAAAV